MYKTIVEIDNDPHYRFNKYSIYDQYFFLMNYKWVACGCKLIAFVSLHKVSLLHIVLFN